MLYIVLISWEACLNYMYVISQLNVPVFYPNTAVTNIRYSILRVYWAQVTLECFQADALKQALGFPSNWDRTDLMDKTLCLKEYGAEFHMLACIDRKCENCGVINLKNELLDLHVSKIVDNYYM